jgi:hypothetical protein
MKQGAELLAGCGAVEGRDRIADIGLVLQQACRGGIEARRSALLRRAEV